MTSQTFQFELFGGDLGPSRVVNLDDAASGMHAVTVVDSTVLGRALGGVRMGPNLSIGEVYRLARAMTLKNALAGLPYGGGAAGIWADPAAGGKEGIIRAFARAIGDLAEYVPCPDMGTDESSMAWIGNEIGRVAGLSPDGGGAIGFGLAECTEVAAAFAGFSIDGATVVVEGFGNVGSNAAKFLEKKGAVVIAASDSEGTVYEPGGIDVGELLCVRKLTGTVTETDEAQRLPGIDVYHVPCDIFVAAAGTDSLRRRNAATLPARLVIQGAHISATPQAEAILHERGVLVVPDIIANSGGAIFHTAEARGVAANEVCEDIRERVCENTRRMIEESLNSGNAPRLVADAMARVRLLECKHEAGPAGL